MATSKEFTLKENITKEKAIKTILNSDGQDDMYIPPEIIPEGVEYARADITRSAHLRFLQTKGWTFVPASRHPDLAFRGIEHQDPRTADLIMIGANLVLMERSIELCELERRKLDKKNYDLMLETSGLKDTPFETINHSVTQAAVGKGEGREASFA